MRDYNGTRVCVTPSILWSTDCAMVAFDGGENGYMHVKIDGNVVDFKMFYSDMDQVWHESHEDWVEKSARYGDNKILELTRTMLNFMDACAESRAYVHYAGVMGENADLFPTEVYEWFSQTELQAIIIEIDEELGE
jgi:hypothetical protein